MSVFDGKSLSEKIAGLYDFFLQNLQQCQQSLVDLDKGEIVTFCLTALASADAGTAILFGTTPEGLLRAERIVGGQPAAVGPFQFCLSEAEKAELVFYPEQLDNCRDLRRLAKELELGSFVAHALVCADVVTGALVLLTGPEDAFPPGQREDLHSLSRHIRLLLQASDTFSSLINKDMVDDLTGLFNRRYFKKRLSAELSRAARHGHPLSLLMCDIDDYKNFVSRNHPSGGDQLIQQLAGLLQAGNPDSKGAIAFRSSDVPVRNGSDEFAAILPETPKWGALSKAERLRKAIEGTLFYVNESKEPSQITMSFGVASFPEDASDLPALLEAAQQALNRAKQQGKNRVEPA